MKLALITGTGDIPQMIAEHRKAHGLETFIIPIKGFVEDWVKDFQHAECGIVEFGRMFELLKTNDCDTISFIGNVKRPDLSKLKPDFKGISLLPRVLKAATKGDDALLSEIVKIFEEHGYQVIGAHELLKGLQHDAGFLSAAAPDETTYADVQKAYEISGEIGRMDIGQGCVVCDGLVLAVEAQEGTDEMLKRVAALPETIRGTEVERKGVLVKRPKPKQEVRIDLPTLGPSTVKLAKQAGLRAIAAVEGGALWVNVPEMKKIADDAGISLISLKSDGQLP